jgi:hypothetical protein
MADIARRTAPPNEQVYEGDHGNRIRERFEFHVLPFFWRVLKAQ